jgi:hypothetical protein
MTGLTSHNFHFAFNDTTKTAILADYLNWFVVMNLLTKQQREDYLKEFPGGGPSTCLLRTEFGDNACRALFFKSSNSDQCWDPDHYLDIGRRAMRALIDPNNSRTDQLRCDLLDKHWTEAVKIGPANDLGPLMGLHPTDSTDRNITLFLIGDVYTIVWWAKSMEMAGEAIRDMWQFLAGADPVTLADSHEFAKRRDQLQKKMAGVIANSRTRFDEPWGLVSLFWASGSIGASARLVAKGLLLQKPDPALAAVGP